MLKGKGEMKPLDASLERLGRRSGIQDTLERLRLSAGLGVFMVPGTVKNKGGVGSLSTVLCHVLFRAHHDTFISV